MDLLPGPRHPAPLMPVSKTLLFNRSPRILSGVVALSTRFAVIVTVFSGMAAWQASCPVEAQAPGSAGWQAQTYKAVHAIQGLHLSQQQAHSGRRSLALRVKLNGGVAATRQGEAFVDLRFYPPAGTVAPVDLAGQGVTAWVYVPSGLEGPARNPNGFRLFVKDSQWKSEYGPWTHARPGHWTRLALIPSSSTPRTGYRDSGFNPHRLVILGVSLATGKGSTTEFAGEMYLDDVAWGSGEGPKYGFEE